MNKTKILTALFIFVLFISGCGKDGTSGVATISLDWDIFVDAYNDNNSSTPDAISRNFEYSTRSGNFECEYFCSDGSGNEWYWDYVYTISINKGEKGKLFSKGENGKDRHHQMFLHGLSEPTYSVDEKSGEKKLKEELKPYVSKANESNKVYQGERIVETFSKNGYTTTVTRRMFTLE